MNFTTLLALIPAILRIFDFAKRIISQGLSINSIAQIFTNEDVKAVFTQLGATLFPKVAPQFQAIAGAVASYSPDYVMKVQNAMNVLLVPPPVPALDIDGHYGALTRAAVERYQKQRGLEVIDGWVGDKTMSAIQADLLKHDDDVKMTAVPAPAIATPLPEPPKG